MLSRYTCTGAPRHHLSVCASSLPSPFFYVCVSVCLTKGEEEKGRWRGKGPAAVFTPVWADPCWQDGRGTHQLLNLHSLPGCRSVHCVVTHAHTTDTQHLMKLVYVRKALWNQASSCLHRPQQGRRPPSCKNAVFLSLLHIFSIKGNTSMSVQTPLLP